MLQKFYLRTSCQLRLLDLEAKSPLYSHLLDTHSGLATIRAFGWQEHFRETNLDFLDLSQRPFYLLYCCQRWLNLVLDLTVAGLAVLLVTLALLVKSAPGSVSIGVSLLSILTLGQNLSVLVQDWTMLETSLGAVSRVKSFVAGTPLEEDYSPSPLIDSLPVTFGLSSTTIPASTLAPTIPLPSWPSTSTLTFDSLTVSYGPRVVLHNVTFSIPSGTKVVLTGPTGSGKSSLLLAIARLLQASTGGITLDGIDLAQVSTTAVRAALTVVPQESLLLPGTVMYNLDPKAQGGFEASPTSPITITAMANSSHANEMERTRDREAALVSALRKVGLWEVVSAHGGLDTPMRSVPLSHGQKQLLCLARAMLERDVNGRGKKGPVLLDEATSALDADTARRMMRLVRDEFAGRTVVAVTHHPDELSEFELVVELAEGRVVKIENVTGSG